MIDFIEKMGQTFEIVLFNSGTELFTHKLVNKMIKFAAMNHSKNHCQDPDHTFSNNISHILSKE
jgi:hypothetical protein